jgi:hypothetical protein
MDYVRGCTAQRTPSVFLRKLSSAKEDDLLSMLPRYHSWMFGGDSLSRLCMRSSTKIPPGQIFDNELKIGSFTALAVAGEGQESVARSRAKADQYETISKMKHNEKRCGGRCGKGLLIELVEILRNIMFIAT